MTGSIAGSSEGFVCRIGRQWTKMVSVKGGSNMTRTLLNAHRSATGTCEFENRGPPDILELQYSPLSLNSLLNGHI